MVDTVRISYERVFAHPLDETFAWLTDYRDDDAQRAGAIIQDRNVLDRREDEILLEGKLETFGGTRKGRARVELDPPDRWTAHLQGPKGQPAGRYEYELHEHHEGCRLTVDYHIAAPRLRDKILLWATRWLTRREIDEMWDGFADAMAEELDGGSPEGSGSVGGSTRELGQQAASR